MKREIEFASHPGNLCLMRDFVRQFLASIDLTQEEKDLMILGLDEACTNVIRHAYLHEPNQPMHLVCEQHTGAIVFRLRDFGEQCDSARLRGRPLDLVQPGGLGLHLMRRAFSSVDYVQQTQGTELVMRKELGEA
jgi:anti-sigma regulatory factor (Ser/Thr protein kinase)